MTAELSQAFRTKREGVGFVLDALEAAFPDAEVSVYTVDGAFRSPAEARALPLEVAAANWAATARFVGREMPDCILVDIGTTSPTSSRSWTASRWPWDGPIPRGC